MSKARIIADYAGTGATSDLATQAELDASETALGFQSVPHIVPDVLYPSYVASGTSNKLLDGTTAHSGAFGTAQSDGRKYYYTNIAGSKPIKDPRIGAHFGSQRHKFKSIQLLEQETATHGNKVYSVDGRENIRIWGSNDLVTMVNDSSGLYINSAHTCQSTIEVVGYFSGINILGRNLVTSLVNQGQLHYIDGVALNSGAEQTDFETSVSSPLGGRYVDNASLVNVTTTQTLGIHTFTLKEHTTSEVTTFFGVELIAQDKFTDATCDYNNDPTITHDANTKILAGMSVSGTGIPAGAKVASVTSSTAFELSTSTTGGAVTNGTLTFGTTEISIPAQNVVSYGKKFAIPATAQHYDPFNGFTNETDNHNTYIDYATSLGTDGWKNGSNYYRPYNGGRVVKWVDSSGTIKTSVNMMPPNAKSIKNADVSKKANASVANDTYLPTFESGTVDHSQAEVAKSFLLREFGNGSANGGTGATYADASMLTTTTDDIAYVMDDGLTSLSGQGRFSTNSDNEGLYHQENGNSFYFTFIGTGISMEISANATGSDDFDKWIDGVQIVDGTYSRTDDVVVRETLAQNLPYGTHILQVKQTTIDVFNEFYREVSFHQPKMPPIPEDAVIIADYMLMADFVKQTGTGSDIYGQISKGVRYISASRDHFYNSAGAFDSTNSGTGHSEGIGLRVRNGNDASSAKLPFFGTTAGFIVEASDNAGYSVQLPAAIGSASAVEATETALDNTASNQYDILTIAETVDLGITKFNLTYPTGYNHYGSYVASPIHTSSHYQPFETPFLYELVGGDRNMEQNNLIVTPDGKSWDEVTRDTSYIGNMVLNIGRDAGTVAENVVVVFDEILGSDSNSGGDAYLPHFYKDFAIAYDRQICLVDGQYVISYMTNSAADVTDRASIFINGKRHFDSYTNDASYWNAIGGSVSVHLKRGDYIQIKGGWFHANSPEYSSYHIERV